MKILLFALTLLISICSFCQYKKEPTLIVNLSSIDFSTPQDILQTSLKDVISNGRWGGKKANYSGWGISYLQGINNYIDFLASGNSTLVKYPYRSGNYEKSKRLLLEVDMGFHIKVLPDKHLIVPYAIIGIGGYYSTQTWGSYLPIGAGIQVRGFKAKKTFFFGSFQYRKPLTSEAQYHFLYNVGMGVFVGTLLKKSRKNYYPPPYRPVNTKAAIIQDQDDDGVPDFVDKCPDKKGISANNGCPVTDADGDGVPDDIDKCPTVAGFIKYSGCPLPDSDGDGVADDFDRCPSIFGFQKYVGCPGVDTDKDGVPDEIDKCPNTPGSVLNNGCIVNAIGSKPKNAKEAPTKENAVTNETAKKTDTTKLTLEKAAATTSVNANGKKNKVIKSEPVRNVFYAQNQSTLDEFTTYNLEQTFKGLRNNGNWQVYIIAYTNKTEATDAANSKLAQERAAAIVHYLTSKGIDKNRVLVKNGGIDTNKAYNTLDDAGHRRAEITMFE